MVFFSRKISVRVPISLPAVRQNLSEQLRDVVVVRGGAYRLEHHYWGEVNGNRATLHGPKAYRRMQFLTVGELSTEPEGTVLVANMQVAEKEPISLLVLIFVVVVGMGLIYWPMLFAVVPLCVALFFWSIAINFRRSLSEITAVLEQLMLGYYIQDKNIPS